MFTGRGAFALAVEAPRQPTDMINSNRKSGLIVLCGPIEDTQGIVPPLSHQ